MAQAQIQINGSIGSNDEVVLGSVVELSNADNSGVLTWEWSLESWPPDSEADIDDPTLSEASFVADKIGSYLVQLNVNDGESIHREIVAVKGERTGVRIPAYKERTEFGGQGWAESRYSDLKRIDGFLGAGSVVVCRNGTGQPLQRGKIGKMQSAQIVSNGVPIPTVALASSGDSDLTLIGVISGGLNGETVIPNGSNFFFTIGGPVQADTSSFAAESMLYIGEDGGFATEGDRPIAFVLKSSIEGVLFVIPQGTGGSGTGSEFPPVAEGGLWPRFRLFGGPLDVWPLFIPIDGRYAIPEAGRIRWVYATRKTPGSSGETIFNVYLNGESLTNADNRPRFIQGYHGEDAIAYAKLDTPCDAGDFIDVRFEDVEEGASEDFFAVVFVQTLSPPSRYDFRTVLEGPLNALQPSDIPLRLARFIVPSSGTVKAVTLARGDAGTSGRTKVGVYKVAFAGDSGGIEETLIPLFSEAEKPSVSAEDGNEAVVFGGNMLDDSIAPLDVIELRLEEVEEGDPNLIGVVVDIEAGGTMRSVLHFDVDGILSVPLLPFSIDGKAVVPEDAEIVKIALHRRKPGTAGRTCVDVLVNGESVFTGGELYGGYTPYYEPCYDSGELLCVSPVDVVAETEEFTLRNVRQGDILEAFVVSVEDDDPEDLTLTIQLRVPK